MRAALGLLVLLIAVAPSADAQATTGVFDVQVNVPSSPQAAGNETAVLFTVSRGCASPASVLPEQVVDVEVHARGSDVVAAGPGQAVFGQQVCATLPQQSVEVRYTVRTPANATPGTVYVFDAWFYPLSGTTPSASGPGNEATVAFTLAVAGGDGAGPSAAGAMDGGEADDLEAPAVPSLLLAAALLAVAVALRRR